MNKLQKPFLYDGSKSVQLSAITKDQGFRNPVRSPLDRVGRHDQSRGAANGLNNRGWVVGWSQSDNFDRKHATIWSDGKIGDLNSFVDPKALDGWVLAEARAVNDMGSIVGEAEKNGILRAFVLNPKRE